MSAQDFNEHDKRGLTLKVRDVMRRNFIVIDGRSTVAEALRTMKRTDAHVLIVKQRHEDDEIGMVLLSDIAKRVVAADRSVERVSVYEIMTKPVVSVSVNMAVRYCARLFENLGLTQAPVIDDGEVVGMVSYDDIVLNALVVLN